MSSKEHDLVCLITLFPQSQMSYMFHFPNVRWTRLQAESMGVPQITVETHGEKEKELSDLEKALADSKDTYKIEAICTGALASVYQKTRVERVCSGLGIECLSPLWGVDPEGHLRKLVREGFVVQVVGVSALGLTQDWLGRIMDQEAVDDLVALGKKYRFHVGLEGGEGETFVLDAPSFKKRIVIESSQKHWNGDSGYLEITGAKTVPKPMMQGEGASSRGPGRLSWADHS